MAPTTSAAPARRLARLDQAAAYLGVSVKTVRRRIAEGHFPGYRSGPLLLLVDMDEVEESLRRIPTRRPA
jgi:excisionase family DNA binding protein